MEKSLKDLPCPLKIGDLGLYFIRIKKDKNQYDYIGKSWEKKKGIMDRLKGHFQKIAGTSKNGNTGETVKFNDMRK